MSDAYNMNAQKQMRLSAREQAGNLNRQTELLNRLEAAVERVEAIADGMQPKRGPGRPPKEEAA